jgi:hypothetical protein
MRYRSPHAAGSGSVPLALRGPKSARTILAAAVAGAIGLVPALTIGSPAFATANDLTVTATTGSIAEGGTLVFSIANTANLNSGTFTIATALDDTPNAHQANLTADLGTPSVTTINAATATFPITVNVPTTQDTLYEYDETFKLVVTDSSSAVVSSAIGTITNDDTAPSYSLSASPTSVTEAASAKTTITATLSAVSGRDTVVTLNTANGTAVAGSPPNGDYTALSNSLITIPAGSLTGTKDILVTNDGVKDQLDTESFTVNASATNVSPTTATTTVSIVDAQSTPKLTLSGGGSVAEGSNASFTVTSDIASELPMTVQWAAVDTTAASGHGTATPGDDFTYPSNRTVTIPAGSTSATITIPLTNDSMDEPDEDYSIAISSPTNAVLGTTTKVAGVITDNPSDVGPTLTITPTAVTEGDAGKSSKTFTATLSAKSGKKVTAEWATAPDASMVGTGHAVAGKDYAAASGTLTFPAGTTTQTFTVDVMGDTIDEGASETFRITTAAPSTESPVTLSVSGPTTITITDDDAAPTVTFGDVSQKEGNSANAVLLPIMLSNPSDTPIVVGVTDAGTGTASATYSAATPGSGDYSLLTTGASAVTIQPEMTSGYAVVLVNGDKIYEPDETVNLTSAVAAGSQARVTTPYGDTATLTLANDDTAPNLAINSMTGKEGDTVDVTGTLTGTSQDSVTLTVTFMGASVHGSKAADASDFTNPGAKVLTIAAGTPETAAYPIASIPLLTDTMSEPAETIVGTGSSLGNVGTVTDGVITIAASGAGPTQPGNGDVTISAPAKVVGAVAVPITGMAPAGSDVELWGMAVGDSGEMKKLATTTSSTAGKYAFSRWIGEGYKFAVKAGETTSSPVTVWVQQNPVFVASSPSKGVLSLAVQGNPRGVGQTVIVQKWVGGEWVNAWRGTTGSDNIWRASAKVASGSWSLRAFVAGYTPDGLLPGYTATKKVTVK